VRGASRPADGAPYHGETRVQLGYELPLSEIVVDFYDKLSL